MRRKQHTRPRLTVTVYTWSPADRAGLPTARYAMGRSLASAKRRADSEARDLGPVFSTWQLRPYARPAWIVVSDGHRAVYTTEQEIRYVPSAGVTGWA